jgi:hypothetical protein
MREARRGAMEWRLGGVVVVFGNDGYEHDQRSRDEVAAVRRYLWDHDIMEFGFATTPDGNTWAMLVYEHSEQEQLYEMRELLFYVVWGAWPGATAAEAVAAAWIIAKHSPSIDLQLAIKIFEEEARNEPHTVMARHAGMRRHVRRLWQKAVEMGYPKDSVVFVEFHDGKLEPTPENLQLALEMAETSPPGHGPVTISVFRNSDQEEAFQALPPDARRAIRRRAKKNHITVLLKSSHGWSAHNFPIDFNTPPE